MAAKLDLVRRVVLRDDGDFDLGKADREAYERGELQFVGVRAEAFITVNDTVQTIKTPGLWGIGTKGTKEDDAYLLEVADQERDTLYGLLDELGVPRDVVRQKKELIWQV